MTISVGVRPLIVTAASRRRKPMIVLALVTVKRFETNPEERRPKPER